MAKNNFSQLYKTNGAHCGGAIIMLTFFHTAHKGDAPSAARRNSCRPEAALFS
jgi:hypothetical protein